MAEFNWLHISDLHWNDKRLKYKWSQVSEEFYDDLEKVHTSTGPFDVVIFSGDLTQSGKKEEFDRVIEKLDEIFKKLVSLGSKNVKFLCVPGNHDLARVEDDPTKKQEIIDLKRWFENDKLEAEFFDKPGSPARVFINKSFREYSEFINQCKLLFPAIHQPGVLPGDFSATFDKDGVKIGVVGLNSAFLHLTDEADANNIAVDIPQIHGVCDSNPTLWCKQNNINILVTHHPPEWLGDNSEDAPDNVQQKFYSDIAPSKRFQAHLFGHVHRAKNTIHSMGGGSLRREFQGTSLFGLEKLKDGTTERIHGYSAGKIIIKDGEGKILWWPRIRVKRLDGSYEFDRDSSFSRDDDGGEYVASEDKFKLNSVNVAAAPSETYAISSPPPAPTATTPTLLGRDTLIAEVMELLHDPKRRLITLLGPPGIGKTTIATALHGLAAPEFGDGAYFCTFRGIEALDGLIAKINAEVANVQDAKEETLLGWFANKNCLLILDNFEDPLTDRANVTVFIRRLIERTHGLKILVTTRERLSLTDLEVVKTVGTLSREDSAALLVRLAANSEFENFLKKGDVMALLDELGDVPLAIVLAVSNLLLGVDHLTQELKNQNVDILREYGIETECADRNQSVCRSFSLSYEKIKDDNERLLFLVCSLFPAGLNKDDAQVILPALRPGHYASLIFKSLITSSDGNTYTMLAPICTYAYGMFRKMINENKIDAAIEKRWIDLCIGKAQEYYNTTRGTGKRDIKALIKELPDIFRVLEYLISKLEKDNLIAILSSLNDFLSFVGVTKEVRSFLEKAGQLAKKAGDILGEANCVEMIGNIHLRESRNKDALNSYNAALPLYNKVGDILGAANCVFSIGDVHLRESRNQDALNSYNAALSLFKHVGDILGAANCVFSIGDIHLRESRNQDALNSYNAALPLFKKVGNILGEAILVTSIGFCLIRDNQVDAGIKEVFIAINLFEKINDKYSVAVAYEKLGMELKEKEGYQERALEYIKKAEEIRNTLQRAMP